mmetsp:Transcript_30957/g.81316  ORF Transcript_30957/g.81316 Transcript_30957/m.81316 type:complete len:201 (-) Transcript_30957:1257-1859(-)
MSVLDELFLSRPSSEIHAHNLTSSLSLAIRTSSAHAMSETVLEALDIRFWDKRDGDDSWDVFTLDYRLPSPFKNFFPRKIMDNYVRVFSFIWTIRRTARSLSELWRNHPSLSLPARKRCKDSKRVLHFFNAHKARLLSFFKSLQYYATFEVLENVWAVFMRDSEKAVRVDDFVKKHEHALIEIVRKLLHILLRAFETDMT